MSAQAFPRSTLPDTFSLLSGANPSLMPSAVTPPSLGLNYAKSSLRPLSNDFSSTSIPSSPLHRPHQRNARPVSEILRPGNYASPETEALDRWFEDLLEYERNLEAMASASVDPKYKEEIQHVDQWFCYLNEAERTAAIYSLLQHSSQVQIRFFITVLQQMNNKDPVDALLSPAHPEKSDMQTQMTSAMAKAEYEASQKLLSVLPYQTGNVVSRPPGANRRALDRHSFALGDTEEYNRLLGGLAGPDFLSPRTPSFPRLDDPSRLRPVGSSSSSVNGQQQQQQRTLGGGRPRSVIEGDMSLFNNDWGFNGAGLVPGRTSRPKSADITNWSFDIDSSDWPLTSSRTTPDDKTFRRRTMQPSIPAVLETDEQQANIVLSMYDGKEPVPVFAQHIPYTNNTTFLNPKDSHRDAEPDYTSDHSDASTLSSKYKKKAFSLGQRLSKDKKQHVDTVDLQLLQDIPAWLRSLRLHKYNPIFETWKWQEMVKLNDEALSEKGVSALGARRKMLKVFEQVKLHCEQNVG
ncbi:hypothetical protein J3Q64DRAFT_1695353 [Phycomyces blakesleeanus]|uniref:RNA-binding protein VTS1 n=3 Tax=Phycomyces blakesleeanus TaxID=4837 RepID=A0ABR3BAT6_PHYBL